MAGGTVYRLSPTAANDCTASTAGQQWGNRSLFVFKPVSTTTTVIIYYYYYYDSDKDATRWRQHNIKYIYNIIGIGIVASGEKSLSSRSPPLAFPQSRDHSLFILLLVAKTWYGKFFKYILYYIFKRRRDIDTFLPGAREILQSEKTIMLYRNGDTCCMLCM